MYQDYGTNTCAGYPGVIKHMALDAQTFADWDVDYVKLDGCYADINQMDEGYPEFGRLLNRTGRPMIYSCSWPVYQEYEGKLVNRNVSPNHRQKKLVYHYIPKFSKYISYIFHMDRLYTNYYLKDKSG